MAANTVPIYQLTPNNQWIGPVVTANTTIDLTAGTIYLVSTAGANDDYLVGLTALALGTNASATVMRVWLNNGGATGTAANNTLIAEATLSATTVSQVAALPPYEISINRKIKAAHRIYVTIGTTVAAGFAVTAWQMSY